MIFDFAQIGPTNAYKIMTSTIVPRPIAWVVTLNAQGQPNCAPFSFFNAMQGDPPLVCLGIASRPEGQKDTLRNIRETEELVIHCVSFRHSKEMNATSADYPPEVDEIAKVGLASLPSVRVAPPRLSDVPVAFECRLQQLIEVGQQRAIVIAEILLAHIHDDYVLDPQRCHINTPALDLIGRMHGRSGYCRTDQLFDIERPVLS
jgi:flavin reductase (DIM6/NTAB) family NADH-FMN oxidoreductase RutF